MLDEDLYERIQVFLPKYLTPRESRELYDGLRSFPDNMNYYTSAPELQEELLQGDGWRGFVVIDFQTGERKPTSGLVLSNSCDISPDNERHWPVRILLGPSQGEHNQARAAAGTGKVRGDVPLREVEVFQGGRERRKAEKRP